MEVYIPESWTLVTWSDQKKKKSINILKYMCILNQNMNCTTRKVICTNVPSKTTT